jgi:anti-sigma factor RsiW
MNCHEIEPLMADAVGDELRAADRAAFESHLSGCESCRREYESLTGAAEKLRALATPARVSVRREGDRLVIEERPPTAVPRAAGPLRAASAFRYAASVLIAFLAGYLLHAGLMFRDAGKERPDPTQMVGASNAPSLRDALVAAHQQSPNASDFAKLIMAMSERS